MCVAATTAVLLVQQVKSTPELLFLWEFSHKYGENIPYFVVFSHNFHEYFNGYIDVLMNFRTRVIYLLFEMHLLMEYGNSFGISFFTY